MKKKGGGECWDSRWASLGSGPSQDYCVKATFTLVLALTYIFLSCSVLLLLLFLCVLSTHKHGLNQEAEAGGGHFPPSVFAFSEAGCGCFLQCSGNRKWAPPLNSSTASAWAACKLAYIHSRGTGICCKAVWVLNDPILTPQWDIWDDL